MTLAGVGSAGIGVESLAPECFYEPRNDSGQGAIREGVDQAWPGDGVVYFARLSAKRVQSKMSRIVGTPEYKQMTIRSWSTTTKLLDLLDEQR